MSDAFTDIAKDERRSRRYDQYLTDLFGYLSGTITKQTLLVSAKETDFVQGGFWGDSTDLSSEENMGLVEKLKQGDSTAWLNFLTRLRSETQKKFQGISPFANKIILSVEHDDRRPSLTINSYSLKSLLKLKVEEKKERWVQISYVVILDPEAFEGAEIQIID